jgi:hypothetical protein
MRRVMGGRVAHSGPPIHRYFEELRSLMPHAPRRRDLLTLTLLVVLVPTAAEPIG